MSYYYLKEVDFMLTHEELMEICQEVQDAVDALADAMYENGGIFNLDLDAHEIYMDNMIHTEDFLWAVYLDNRDSMSDEDAEAIIRTIVVCSNVEGFATGTMDIAPEVRMLDVQWDKI